MVEFDHAVIYNGKYYPAHTPIEEMPENATETARDGVSAEGGANTKAAAEAPKKATKSRKKGDA